MQTICSHGRVISMLYRPGSLCGWFRLSSAPRNLCASSFMVNGFAKNPKPDSNSFWFSITPFAYPDMKRTFNAGLYLCASWASAGPDMPPGSNTSVSNMSTHGAVDNIFSASWLSPATITAYPKFSNMAATTSREASSSSTARTVSPDFLSSNSVSTVAVGAVAGANERGKNNLKVVPCPNSL